MEKELKAGPENHCGTPGVVLFEERIPEEHVGNVPARTEGPVSPHEHSEPLPVEGKPAEIVRRIERCRTYDDFLVQTREHRNLVVAAMALTEMNRVVPGKHGEQTVKKLIQRSGFKGSLVAELVNRRLHTEKAGKHRMEITGKNHGIHIFSRKKYRQIAVVPQVDSQDWQGTEEAPGNCFARSDLCNSSRSTGLR